jgi:amino acid transporter
VVVPVFLLLIIFWKYTRQTEIWKPDEMDFTTVSVLIDQTRSCLTWHVINQGIPSYEETEGPEILPKGFWQHVAAALF